MLYKLIEYYINFRSYKLDFIEFIYLCLPNSILAMLFYIKLLFENLKIIQIDNIKVKVFLDNYKLLWKWKHQGFSIKDINYLVFEYNNIMYVLYLEEYQYSLYNIKTKQLLNNQPIVFDKLNLFEN